MPNDKPVTDLEVVGEGIPIDPNKEVKIPQETPKVQLSKEQLEAKQVDTKPEAEVSLDDFLAIKDNIEKITKPSESPAKKEEPVVEAKPKTEEKPVTEKPVEKPVNKPEPKADEDKRVYDDLPENLRPIFKKLHNEPFNTFKPIVQELTSTKTKLQELEKQYTELKKGALPDNYYEHQKGYILSPDFEQAANTAIRAEQIANHWKAQADRIRKGEPTYQDVNINQRTGELYLSDPMQVTKDTEAKIDSYVEWAQNQLAEKQYAVRAIAEKHGTTHKEALSQITDFENAAFKVFEGEKKKEWEPIIQDTINKTFPPAFRNNPLARGYAKALLSIKQLGEALIQAKKAAPEAPIKTEDGKVISKEDKIKAGPTAGDMAQAGGTPSKSDDEVTMDDFKNVINGGEVYMRR